MVAGSTCDVMEYRHVGKMGQVAPAIGLGCLPFTDAYGAAHWDDMIPTIRLAIDMGIGLILVADSYGGGRAERLIGQAVVGRHHETLIATQGGTVLSGDGQIIGIDGSPAHLRRACDASLRRLGVDQLDLYFLAQVDPRVRLDESVGAIAELVHAGKVRYIGLPAVPRTVLRQAHAEHPITAVLGEYSLWQRDAERELLPAARELAVGFLACGPLGRGFLTGRIISADGLGPGDSRRDDPRFRGENVRRNRELLHTAEQIAARRDIGIGRLALAWLLAQGDDIVPVPGTHRRAHVEMNATAVGVRLDSAQCRELAEAFPPGAVAGADEWWHRQTQGSVP